MRAKKTLSTCIISTLEVIKFDTNGAPNEQHAVLRKFSDLFLTLIAKAPTI